MELEKQIQRYVANNLVYLDDPIAPDTSLIGEGLIDSVGIIELVTYVQSEFGITIDQHEITLENFDSIGSVAAFIRTKQSHMGSSERPAARQMPLVGCAAAAKLG